MFNLKFTPKAAILIGTVLVSTSAIACDVKDLAGTYRYYSTEPRICTIEIDGEGKVRDTKGVVNHCSSSDGRIPITGGRFKFHKTVNTNDGNECWVSAVIRTKTRKFRILEAMVVRDTNRKILLLTGWDIYGNTFTMPNFTGGSFNPNVTRKLQR